MTIFQLKGPKYHTVYRMTIISFIMTVFITILILSVILHSNFEGISMRQTQSLTINNLEKVVQGTNFMVSTAKNLSIQVFNDSNISKLLYSNSNSYADINIALAQLGYYRQTTPFIESIYVYNVKEKTFFISSSNAENLIQDENNFYDKEISRIVKDVKMYKQLSPIPRGIKNSNISNRDIITNVYTFIYLGIPVSEKEPDFAVIINVSAEWVNELTDGMNQNADSNTFLINKDGKIVSYSYLYPMLSDISNQSFTKRIINSGQESGYFKEKIDKNETMITYLSLNEIEWFLIQLTPYINVVKGIKDLRNNTIITAFIILLVGLLITFMLSRKMHTNIEKILSKLKRLEEERVDNFYTLKQEFLRNFLLDSRRHNPEIMQVKLTDFEIKLDTSSQFTMILLVIDHYTEFCDKYNLEDRKTFKFAIMNIANELFSNFSSNVESVDMGDDKVALLMNLSENNAKQSKELIEKCIREIRLNVLNYLKISITAVIGTPVESLYNLNNMYSNLVEASYHRMVYGYGSIISAEIVNEFRGKSYKYSFEKEKILIDNLMLGNIKYVKKIYLEIINEVKGCTFITIQFVLSRLIFSIKLSIDTIEKNSFIKIDQDININQLFFSNTETLDEICERVFNIFDHISDNLQENKSSSYDCIINKIKEIIDSEYMNQSLSISYIAEKMDLSNTYVGRLFKKYESKSIVEYIMETRLKKANELLMSTNGSIEDIANTTGFSSGVYFHTSYKKHYGVTPGDHRLKIKMQIRQD